ncbi:S-crystallin SL11-like [Dreissena polymorpha]|uniref:S-crystallin SL11-like n=1 Tax=Dreissena polymorpha TaxID=45954 RepID=UPI0022642D42|nr:S-crystallin SL11-like [Dreissena polymorpha]
MPQYVVPVLEVDGRTNITQSMAISRYLARQFDLYGKNAQEMALVDQIIETVEDIFFGVLKFLETPKATERVQTI